MGGCSNPSDEEMDLSVKSPVSSTETVVPESAEIIGKSTEKLDNPSSVSEKKTLENPFLRPTPYRRVVPTMIPLPTPTPTRLPALLERPTPLPTPTRRPRPTATATPTPTATPTAKEFLENARTNRPTKGPEHHYIFTENISDDLISQHGEIHKYLIDILGGYDRYVHVIYDFEGDNEYVIDALNELGLLNRNIPDSKEDDSAELAPVWEFYTYLGHRSCLGSFSEFDIRDARNEYNICIQSNPLTAPGFADDRELFGLEKFQYKIFYDWAHQYFHHYQQAHNFDRSLAMPDDCCGFLHDSVGAPAWWVEGAATLFTNLFLNEYFYKLSYTQERQLTIGDGEYPFRVRYEWDDHFSQTRKKMIEGSGSGCHLVGADEEYRETAKCDWFLMTVYLAYITSYQTLFVDLLSDMWELGFDASFQKNVGMSKEQFYNDYNNFMTENGPDTPSPDGFFPEKALKQLVNFWAIDSG